MPILEEVTCRLLREFAIHLNNAAFPSAVTGSDQNATSQSTAVSVTLLGSLALDTDPDAVRQRCKIPVPITNNSPNRLWALRSG